MVFNSVRFALFFPVVAALYFLLPRRMQWGVILAASIYFYMCFQPEYILIPACTILIDFYVAQAMEKREIEKRRPLLAISLAANLGALALFKYFNFLNHAFAALLAPVNLADPIPFLKLIAPVGLSFQVFRSLSYILEVYWGRYKAEQNLGIYATYVMFFPELISGPIERPKSLLPQLKKPHAFVYAEVVSGLQLALFGLFKKVMLADRLAPFVEPVYANPHAYTGPSFVIAIVAFTFQLYCDFSGYTDMARGIGQILGFNLMKNFDRPYFSKSMTEFWRRWHISLSTWFRDYVFIPLALTEPARRIENIAVVESIILVLTFLISGLWHGAAWTYVIWGGLNGLFMAIELLLEERFGKAFSPQMLAALPMKFVRVGFNMCLVCFAAALFRAPDLKTFGYIAANLGTGWLGLARRLGSPAFVKLNILLGQDKDEAMLCALCLAVLLTIHWIQRTHSVRALLASQKRFIRWTIYYAAIAAILFYGAFNKAQQFIYVQF
jgi:D-alanyl-lipoteichoic acid acyltransferase DltB (MBOAT superfamily)